MLQDEHGGLAHLAGERPPPVDGCRAAGDEPIGGALEHGVEQRDPIGEVAVHRTARQPGLGGNVAHGHPPQAELSEAPLGRVEDALPRRRGLEFGRDHRGPPVRYNRTTSIILFSRHQQGHRGDGMGRFDGRTAVVTGAASGIGEASAARLLSEGAIVVGVDVTPPGSPPADGGRWIPVAADVRDEDAVAAAVGTAVEAGGRLDGVVHAAGVAGGGPVHLLEAAEWHRVLDVNLTGTYHVVRHAVLRMLDQEPVDGERGSIVTLASIEGLEGTAGGSSYNASKGGVVLLTKNVAIDYGPSGIGSTRSARASSTPR